MYTHNKATKLTVSLLNVFGHPEERCFSLKLGSIKGSLFNSFGCEKKLKKLVKKKLNSV